MSTLTYESELEQQRVEAAAGIVHGLEGEDARKKVGRSWLFTTRYKFYVLAVLYEARVLTFGRREANDSAYVKAALEWKNSEAWTANAMCDVRIKVLHQLVENPSDKSLLAMLLACYRSHGALIRSTNASIWLFYRQLCWLYGLPVQLEEVQLERWLAAAGKLANRSYA